MEKKSNEEFHKIINQIKELVPDAIIQHQPDCSLKELIAFENEYKINTSEIFENQLTEVELSNLSFNVYSTMPNRTINNKDIPFNVMKDWIDSFRTFRMFNGDISLINTI